MNWQIGPARCRSDEYEAEILATDMGGEKPLLVRFQEKGAQRWFVQHYWLDGRACEHEDSEIDLIPPRLTLEEAARECERVRASEMATGPYGGWINAMQAALQHYEKMKKEGRV